MSTIFIASERQLARLLLAAPAEGLWSKWHSCSPAVGDSRPAVALQCVPTRELKNAWILLQQDTPFFHHSSALHICAQCSSSTPAGAPETLLLTAFSSPSSSDLSFKCQLWGPFAVTYNLHLVSDCFSLGIPHSQHSPILLKTGLWNNFYLFFSFKVVREKEITLFIL